jgi:subtilase family serine protease
MACMAMAPTQEMTAPVEGDGPPQGFGPADIDSAYNLPVGQGAGRTIAIVDAYDDPNAEQDLARYRSQYGLPACTTANGCFRKVNQLGQASPLPDADQDWAFEISIDLDMVSAGCPQCKILLVEAVGNGNADMYRAEDTAASSASFVSNSWGNYEYPGETSDDVHFNHPGVAITFSTGDVGTPFGPSDPYYPAASRYVTAVGGTSLQRNASTGRGWTESAWGDATSGCSLYESRPSWQSSAATGCANRATADVSALADPDTPVVVADSYNNPDGWYQAGGTSVAAPLIAAAYALAGPPTATDSPAWYPYARTVGSSLFDVVSGTNGSCGAPMCAAGIGWDGPTGLGTPNGINAFSVPMVAVPNVLGWDQASATNEVNASGLTVGGVSTVDNCVDTGSVQNQNPSGGFMVEIGASVHFTVSTCSSGGGAGGGGSTGSGGSGGSGGGDGHPGGGGGNGGGNPHQPL